MLAATRSLCAGPSAPPTLRLVQAHRESTKRSSQQHQAGRSSSFCASPFGVIKPQGMALLSEEEQAVGSQAYKKDDATDGSQDSLISRLKRNFSSSSSLSKKLTDPWSGFYVPFASPRDWNSGKGLQLVLTTEEQVQFIKECNNLGLVSREYMVLVHVPDCIDTSDYQLSGSLFEAGRGGYDQIEGARTANHHHHQGGSGALSGAGERSTKKFTNPLLRQAMERREQRFKDLSAKKKISDIPRCIKQQLVIFNRAGRCDVVA